MSTNVTPQGNLQDLERQSFQTANGGAALPGQKGIVVLTSDGSDVGSGGGGGGAVTIADGADTTQGAIADAAVQGDNSGTVSAKLRGINKTLTAGVTVVSPVSTLRPGQKVIAFTGTQVALSVTSQILANGIVVSALSTNNIAGGTVGLTGVTNTVDGSGNGLILEPGGSIGIPPGVNLNTIFVNGTAGDIFSFIGN